MGRRWVPVVIVFVGSLLGLAVAGLPTRREDTPLAVQTATSTTPTTTAVGTTIATTAVAPTSTTVAASRPPGDVRVMAFNSSGAEGAAGRLGTRLKSQGYTVQSPGPDRRPQETSVVMYRSGYEAEARALASALGLAAGVAQPIEASIDAVSDTDLALLIGNDLARTS